ncbi:hypothetical protein BHM03_00058603, partial [Ensete ventricosum]
RAVDAETAGIEQGSIGSTGTEQVSGPVWGKQASKKGRGYEVTIEEVAASGKGNTAASSVGCRKQRKLGVDGRKKPMEGKKKAQYNGLRVMLVALALLLGCNTMAEAITCNDAVSGLIPCGSYLIGQGGADPSPRCCESARALNRMASTVASRRQLCECLKQTGPSFGVKPERVQHLPPFCKIDLNMPVSPDVDCSRYVILQPSIDVECRSAPLLFLPLTTSSSFFFFFFFFFFFCLCCAVLHEMMEGGPTRYYRMEGGRWFKLARYE